MIYAILSALAPIAFVALLGGWAAHAKLVNREQSGVIATFVVRFALPLSLFLVAAKTAPSDLKNIPLLLSLGVGLVGSFVAGLLQGRFLFGHDLKSSAVQALACSFPNAAYCGPPVLAAAVGGHAVLTVVLANLIVSTVLVPTALVFLHANDPGQTSLVRLIAGNIVTAVKQPLVWLPLAGVAFALLGFHLPAVVESAVDQIGRAAGGAALFTLGVILYGQRPRLDRETICNVAVKNVLQPVLIGATALAFFGLSSDITKEAFLIGVLPAATVVPAIALRASTYADEAATSVLMSNLFAIVSISVGIAIAKAV